MKKLLFAINYRQLENQIAPLISDEYEVVGSVEFRETIAYKIAKTGADTVLIRESLPGSLPVEETLEQIRETYPDVRIVLICGQYKEDAPFLKKLEELGIHDVINADYVSHEELADLILHPVISDPE